VRIGRWIVAVLIVIAPVAGAGYLYRSLRNEPSPGESAPAGQSSMTTAFIAVSQPVTRTLVQAVPWVGVVESRARVQVKALQAGGVETIDVQDETPVKPGATILQLGGPQIEMQRARLQADAQSLQSQLALAQQTAEQIKQSLGAQLATREQLATAQEAQVKLAGDLRNAQLALQAFEQQVRIVAPAAGVFTNRRVSAGQTVSSGDVVGEIVDANNLRITASVFVRGIVALEGREATVRIDATQSLAGTVRRILPQAGSTGATIVWIEGPQINERLRPGQSVSGQVTIAVRQAALTVPRSAIVYDANEQPLVFVEEDGTYESRPVRLGLTQDSWVEVLSGLEPGQPVVTRGAYELFYRRFNEQFKVED
jgi:RND family efflux transporter MFP subunit